MPTPVSLDWLPELSYPSNDLLAWKYCIYWITHGDFVDFNPVTAAHVELLVRCALLGEKHFIKNFTDWCRMYLLLYYDDFDVELGLKWQDLHELFAGLEERFSIPYQKVYGCTRLLIAEEIVKRQEASADPISSRREYAGIPDLQVLLDNVRRRFQVVNGQPPGEFFGRLQMDRWRGWMDGDMKHLPFNPRPPASPAVHSGVPAKGQAVE